MSCVKPVFTKPVFFSFYNSVYGTELHVRSSHGALFRFMFRFDAAVWISCFQVMGRDLMSSSVHHQPFEPERTI